MIDYYKILNISQNASLDDIKKAYHNLAKKYHPDNYKGSEEQSSEHMSRINEAYDVLMDQTKKAAYDKRYRQRNCHEENTSDNNKTTYNPTPDKEGAKSGKAPDSCDKKTKSPQPKARNNNIISGCLSKIFECCIYVAIILFLVNHFNLSDKIKSLIDNADNILVVEDKENVDESPDGCINSYFNAFRECNTNAANKLISNPSYVKSNKTIIGIYQSIHKDDRYYQLYKEIVNFTVHIDDISYNANKTKAMVTVTIQNIDCYGFMANLFSSCKSESAFESLSQKELNKKINKMMKKKKNYMAASVCILEVEKTEELWKISDIDDVDAMISILVGKIDLLVNSIES